jgi:hypothetical protein
VMARSRTADPNARPGEDALVRRGQRDAARRRPRSASRGRQGGQTLAEFALAFPIFLVLVFGFIDLSRYVYLTIVLSQAAREGARTVVVEAKWIGSNDPMCAQPGDDLVANPGKHACPADVAALHADVAAAVNRMASPFGPIASTGVFMSCDPAAPPVLPQWTDQSCLSPSTGSIASVRVETTFTALTPVIGTIIGPIGVTSSASKSGASSMTIY